MADHDAVVAAASTLDVRPRSRRWAHLSLCVLDAVFSIGARYGSTVRTCQRYADHAGLAPLVDASSTGSVNGTNGEQPLSAFVAEAADPVSFARDVLSNRQRTSPRGGVLKAEAALRYAQALVDAGVERYRDVEGLFDDEPRMAAITDALRAVPGNGASDIRLGYLWMLLGDDEVIKPDRMVLRWLETVLGRHPTAQEARGLVGEAAVDLGCTPWELDHAIWQARRSRRPVIASDTAVTRRHRALQGRWRDEVLGLPADAPTSGRTTVSIAVLSELSGRGLADFDRVEAGGGPYALDGLHAGWAPPREQHLGDRSAFDIAAAVARAQTVVPVAHWGLSRLLDVAAHQAELADWADAIRVRYLADDEQAI